MNTKIILAMMAIFLLSGCSGDDANDTVIPNQEKSEIRFDINSQKYTRANIIDNDTELRGQALRIDAYYHGTTTSCLSNTKLAYSGGNWVFQDGISTTHYYWPIEGSVTSPSITVGSLDFVGYCPNDLANTSVALNSYTSVGYLSFSCTDMPMTSAGQSTLNEFMCAYTANRNQAGGTVGMTFYHPFSYVKFQLAASHPNIRINSITLKNLKTGGNCTFDGTAMPPTSTWSSLTPAGTEDFVATINQDYYSTAIPQQIGDNYIMVPQTFAGDIVVKATWTDWGENIEHTVSTKLSSADWQPGKSYIYTFTITETDLIVNTDKYTEQW